MTELATTYLGLALRSPLVASASPLNGDPETARVVEDAGAAAVVMPSLFEEDVREEELLLTAALEAGSHQSAEASGYFPALPDLAPAGERYLRTLERLKAAVGVPVIASLNATSAGGWTRYAPLLESAGADAIELNLYHLAADPSLSADDVESRDVEIVRRVCASVDVPVAVKLSPYYSAMANLAHRVVAAGAAGLVLFNRFYQPDVDLETRDVVARVDLSQPSELRLPLRWIALLRPQLGGRVSLAATSGIHRGADVVKALMVGADVAMLTSALLAHGPQHLRTVESELRSWLEAHEYESVGQLRGSVSHATAGDPSAFERANYLATLRSWTTR
jgi:dihydroorotate dehydrogenase (fumarate)